MYLCRQNQKQQKKMNAKHYRTTTLALILLSSLSAQAYENENEIDTLAVRDMDEIVVVSTPKEHALLRSQPLSSTTAWQMSASSQRPKRAKARTSTSLS